MNKAIKAAILGAGSWGTALALVLARRGHQVVVWGRPEDGMKSMEEKRENKLLPGVNLDSTIRFTTDLATAAAGADMVVLSVPAQAIRGVVKDLKPVLNPASLVVNTAKGIEVNSLKPLSQVVAEELGGEILDRYAVLSGPTHAEEVARSVPTAIVVAARHSDIAYRVQDAFMCSVFRVYTNPDVTGVEVGGALKNIIALGTGIAEGLGLGDNSRAALLTRGLTEIARMGTAMGAQQLTFVGLAGVGDLVVTCGSMHSRNRRCGILLGKKVPAAEAMAQIGMVVEGVTTTQAAYQLAAKLGLEMPITNGIYNVLYQNADPEKVMWELMSRSRKHESEEILKQINEW
ncbi:MAG: NAD(P)H-dependent glycerol-3-phosphate dehydrogenase [Methylocystaceae bacterium]